MSKQKIWDIHLKVDGQPDAEMQKRMQQLAESIAEEPGVLWKIWTYEDGTNHIGSTYLFKDIEHLHQYRAMHIKRLNDLGITDITDHVFDIMEDLSKITKAPLA
jgi:hypothetical protein